MNLTVTNILRRLLPLKGFCYRSARWVRDAGAEGPAVIEVSLEARAGAKGRCGGCGVRMEWLPWASGKFQVCDALRIFLAQWARLLSWQEVATRSQVRWNDVYGAVKWVVRYGLRHRDLSGIRALGVDEVC